MASSVDFPEPEAPTTATASPGVTARSISRRMTRSDSPLFTVFPMPRAIKTWLLIGMLSIGGAARASQQQTILVFGDSLSAAYGIAQARGWVALLAERLKRERPDYSVVNASISGETTAGGAARLARALESHGPAVVILELGANDGLRGLPIAQMKQNLSRMIVAAQKSGARVLLVGMKLPPNYGPDYSRAFESAFGEAAKQHKTALVPFLLEDVAANDSLFQPDRIHPTETAQPLILERVWKALAPLLNNPKQGRTTFSSRG
jgi:acyl-CoA thioesterase-1